MATPDSGRKRRRGRPARPPVPASSASQNRQQKFDTPRLEPLTTRSRANKILAADLAAAPPTDRSPSAPRTDAFDEKMPQFRDENIAIISPGSHTTLAQLGLPESFTPPTLRVKSRMFPGENPGEWEPYKVRKKPGPGRPNGVDGADESNPSLANVDESEVSYEEDFDSDEGAVWPIQAGRITNWSCFFALMSHVYNLISPPFHTPILLIAEPAWTLREHEKITNFFFEKFKTPGFALVDAAVAACYAHGLQTACVVDVGADKANVTAITEFLVDEIGRSVAVPGCGGEAMTARLLELLKSKGFNREMCEQLKKSSICEILPPGVPLPASEAPQNGSIGSATGGPSTAMEGVGPTQRHNSIGSVSQVRRTSVDKGDNGDDEFKEEDEGVIDVASIVAGGKTNEYLARKEKEKAERAALKKKSDAGGAAAKVQKLRNSEREKNSFYYEDHSLLDALKSGNMNGSEIANAVATLDESPTTTKPTHAALTTSEPMNEQQRPSQQNGSTDNGPTLNTIPPTATTPAGAPRREVTVGHERFLAASGPILERLSSAVHRTILSVPHTHRRSELWENLILVGAGSSVRGFREALLATLHARFLISPSSATIFTSELPSNFSTPLPTGANTPLPGQQQQQHTHHGPGGGHGAGVNPLLLAATSSAQAQAQAHLQHLQPPQAPHTPQQNPQTPQNSQQQQHQQQQHSSHHVQQTPTSIRFAKLPEYFPEWKETDGEEATFLGAQVAAKVLFIVDPQSHSGQVGGQNGKGWLARSEYNEQGPGGVHEVAL